MLLSVINYDDKRWTPENKYQYGQNGPKSTNGTTQKYEFVKN